MESGKDNPEFLLLVSYSTFLQDLPLDNIQQMQKKEHSCQRHMNSFIYSLLSVNAVSSMYLKSIPE